MKPILIFLLLFFISSHSKAQYSYDFVVDGKYYSMTEGDLNDCFGNAFDKVVEHRYAKERDFDLWAETFNEWKGHIRNKKLIIEMIGNRISNTTILGDVPAEYRGFKKNEKPAKGNPNDKDNISKRVEFINSYIRNEIVYKLTGKIVK